MNRPSQVDVALCGDRNFLPGMAATLAGALRSLPRRTGLRAHLLVSGIEEDLLARLERNLQARYPRFSLDYRDVGSVTALRPFAKFRLGRMAMARILLPDIFTGLGRFIYLDGDVIVNASLAEFLATSLGGATLAGGYATWRGYILDERWNLNTAHLPAGYSIPQDARYLNNGIFMMDAARYRKHGFGQKVLQVAENLVNDNDMADQAAMNIVLHEHWLALDERWNYTVMLGGDEPAWLPAFPALVHTVGPLKPWHFPPGPHQGLVSRWHRDYALTGLGELLPPAPTHRYPPETISFKAGTRAHIQLQRERIRRVDFPPLQAYRRWKHARAARTRP